jgi:membrane associated rhomboid family serine protease
MFRDLKKIFSEANALTRLILINAAFYLFYKSIFLFLFLLKTSSDFPAALLQKLAVPASLKTLLEQPWSPFTYMFVHGEFFHIFFNMLWLYWMGTLFLEYIGGRKLVVTYILGALSGAALYIAAYNIFPAFEEVRPHAYAIGASGGVMAIIIGIATLIPDYRLQLLFLGSIPLKYIAIFYVLLDYISISEGNAGGHISHLGGALFGFISIRQLKKGRDISSVVTRITDSISALFRRKDHLSVVYKSENARRRPISDDEYAMNKKHRQEIIDNILDKISQSGYESLTKKEKEILFRISKEEKE